MKRSNDRDDRWTVYDYDALMRTTAVHDPEQNTVSYEWCSCGHMRKLIDANGRVTHWKRDIQGRVYEKEYPDGSTESSEFNSIGRVY